MNPSPAELRRHNSAGPESWVRTRPLANTRDMARRVGRPCLNVVAAGVVDTPAAAWIFADDDVRKASKPLRRNRSVDSRAGRNGLPSSSAGMPVGPMRNIDRDAADDRAMLEQFVAPVITGAVAK
jgi:hypothetical protein